jgi:hypothetical protein
LKLKIILVDIFLSKTMTELLEQAISQLKTLPSHQQYEIAALILQELMAET